MSRVVIYTKGFFFFRIFAAIDRAVQVESLLLSRAEGIFWLWFWPGLPDINVRFGAQRRMALLL